MHEANAFLDRLAVSVKLNNAIMFSLLRVRKSRVPYGQSHDNEALSDADGIT